MSDSAAKLKTVKFIVAILTVLIFLGGAALIVGVVKAKAPRTATPTVKDIDIYLPIKKAEACGDNFCLFLSDGARASKVIVVKTSDPNGIFELNLYLKDRRPDPAASVSAD